jgi:hypothetical protein
MGGLNSAESEGTSEQLRLQLVIQTTSTHAIHGITRVHLACTGYQMAIARVRCPSNHTQDDDSLCLEYGGESIRSECRGACRTWLEPALQNGTWLHAAQLSARN